MADDGEYELLPHEELEYLRNELHKIKRNPIQGYKQADDLKASIDALNTSINNLITLFSNTNDELVDAFKKTTIEEHFENLSSQNEQIAQGILAVAKLVEDANTSSISPQQNQGVPAQPRYDQSMQDSMSSSDPLAPAPLPEPQLDSSIPPSMEPPMPAGQTQPLPEQAPSFPGDDLAPPAGNPQMDMMMPPQQDVHPLNSQNLGAQPPLPDFDMDLPPPPEKKKGLLGMFK